MLDHRVFAICSDGDLIEGVAAEATSLAGHLGLGRLVYLDDDNHITIDGDTALSFATEDVGARFRAYGWHVQAVSDANDLAALSRALEAAIGEDERPSLIRVGRRRTRGAPRRRTARRSAPTRFGPRRSCSASIPIAIARGRCPPAGWRARCDAVIAATGSEVALALEAQNALSSEGTPHVVSMPSWELVETQPDAHRESLFPRGVPVVVVEAGVRLGWERSAERTVSVNRFGASAPGEEVLRRLGVTSEAVTTAVRELARWRAANSP